MAFATKNNGCLETRHRGLSVPNSTSKFRLSQYSQSNNYQHIMNLLEFSSILRMTRLAARLSLDHLWRRWTSRHKCPYSSRSGSMLRYLQQLSPGTYDIWTKVSIWTHHENGKTCKTCISQKVKSGRDERSARDGLFEKQQCFVKAWLCVLCRLLESLWNLLRSTETFFLFHYL